MSAPRVVVVGSGIAGLVAALHAHESGCAVTIVTKNALAQSNTRYAQGGVAAALGDDDRVEDHVRDTLSAAAGLADEEAVRVLATEGPSRIRELIARGVRFDRDAHGELRRGREAAHSAARVLHAGGDATGAEIERALVADVRAAGIPVIEHAFLDDVVLEAGRAAGVAVRDATGARRLAADAVVLATGGAGQLYAHTTNPEVATGDGIAAALRAGAHVADLEFVQFHPTVLTLPSGAFLVSEAVRGDGAALIDDEGRRFAFDAHPDGELAPRDVVARAIARRMRAQDGHPVRLDATALGAEFLAARFPTIDGMIRAAGWDWSREPVPVTPAAHYLMGGVMTDLHGRTSVPGLYAVGEVARTGVHGANRLASNSLLEGAVFGARAGDAIAADATSGAWPRPDAAAFADAAAPVTPLRPSGPAADAAGAPPFSRAALQRLMWEDAGLERTADGLAHAARILDAWHDAGLPTATVAEAEDADLVLVARAVVAAALARTASVGAHYRADTDAAASAPAATIAETVAC